MPISTSVTVNAGTPVAVANARKYHGAVVYPDGTNAATLVVYRGGAATGGKEVESMRVLATQSGHSAPVGEVDLDPEGGLYAVLTGTGAVATVRFSY